VNRLFNLLVLCCLSACTAPSEPLVVKQFQLRDQAPRVGEEPMVKMEKERRLHGAVSMAERRNKLGQYYTLIWNNPSGVGQGIVELTLEYQQGATASQIKKQVKHFPSSNSTGLGEFAVTGDDYFQKGRVLAWKATLRRGDHLIATRQSYLWQ
jgi:hypothetical protein